jgi:hypothetical protein
MIFNNHNIKHLVNNNLLIFVLFLRYYYECNKMKKIQNIPKISPEKLTEDFFAGFLNYFRSFGNSEKDVEKIIENSFSNISSDFTENFDNINWSNIDYVIEHLKDKKAISNEDIDFFEHNRQELVNFLKKFMPMVLKKLSEDVSYQKTTFALPSHPLMLTLMALFSGKHTRIPKKLIQKPQNLLTPKEQETLDDFFDSIIEEKVTGYSPSGEEEKEIFAIISDNQKVEAKAIIHDSFLNNNELFKNYSLPYYIRDTFGAEGLRHFLGFIVGLEESGRVGTFTWDVNQHLARLGYKRKANGSFDPDLKKKATAIILLLDQLYIVAEQKENDKHKIQGNKLFTIVGFDIENFKGEIINERLTIRAEEYWYSSAFSVGEWKNQMYTKLLKKIVHENHWEHSLTIYLTPLLAIFWRMSPERKFSVSSLMKWCSLDISGKQRTYNLNKLEDELIYMRKANYLGEWFCNGEKNKLPSQFNEPFKCILNLTPPSWLMTELDKIEKKKDFYIQEKKDTDISRDYFIEIYKSSGLNIIDFCNKLGISRQMFYYIKNGKREISRTIKKKIEEYYMNSRMLTKM